jgi:hypothetical protein
MGKGSKSRKASSKKGDKTIQAPKPGKDPLSLIRNELNTRSIL